MNPANTATLEIKNFSIGYDTEIGLLQAVRNVSLAMQARESFGLVGESGSGKTTLALGAIQYLAANGSILDGQVFLRGKDLTNLPRKEMAHIWGRKIGMVYQNPGSALNPSLTIGHQLAETARVHQKISRAEAYDRALAMLAKVVMPKPESVVRQYPHQLSGGMLQRCVIAMSLINNPQLLIMDEPTTALDVTTQVVVLDLVAALKQEFDSTIFYITHDLAVVAKICDRIGVMYAGELMEIGTTRELFKKPLHPYTLSLLGCIPHFKTKRQKSALISIPGLIPRLDDLPPGCIFAPRCSYVQDKCRQARPPLMEVQTGHWSACLRWQVLPDTLDPGAAERKRKPPAESSIVLKTEALKKHFAALDTFFGSKKRRKKQIKAVDGVSLHVRKGYTLGIVGESGCGKTTLVRTIIGLLEPTSGEIRLDDARLGPTTSKRPRTTLKKLQIVFQHPEASLNPRRTVAQTIQRPMVLLQNLDRNKLMAKTFELLEAVNLPASYCSRLPGELSGGEKQRVAIARAFAADPELILLDEPLSALDVSVQASLINLLFDLQRKGNTTYLFISHDLAAVQHFSDWLAVMYLGHVVEWGDAEKVFTPPYHPYTEALLSAIPVADPEVEQQNIRLAGSVPSAMDIPAGCPFHTRCPRYIGQLCETKVPPWREGPGQNRIWCHHPLDELITLQAEAIAYRRKEGEVP
jgi:peptide/nickel transport system ATP-binding protein